MKAALLALAALALGAGAAAAGTAADRDARPPEAATGLFRKAEVRATRAMVVAAHPLAAEAGRDAIRDGGSAVDAAIVAILVLNLVEPQSAGLGGGGFLVLRDAAGGGITTFDGRETAPASVDVNLFRDGAGRPRPWPDIVTGGAATGVPGLLAMLDLAHRRHGRLDWARLVAPALGLAENGYPVGRRLASLLSSDPRLARDPAARALFFRADGSPAREGDMLKNPDFAATLRMIAAEGPAAFYRPPFAARLVEAVGRAPNPGRMSLADIAAYRAVERPPVCGDFRAWRVCGMGPPSSGGIVLAQILGLVARAAPTPREGEDGMAIVIEAMRLAYADRDAWVADPDRVAVPTAALVDPRYLDGRARLIDIAPRPAPRPPAPAGTPEIRAGALPAAAPSPEVPSTTHLSVVDAEGDAVALTASIEGAFGTARMVGGFLLNNQLTDFSDAFDADREGRPVANRIEGGKRPRSAMTPTIVTDGTGALAAITGSPGGARIPGFVARTLVDMLDHGDGPLAALSRPHYLDRNRGLELEAGTPLADAAERFAARGYATRTMEMNSGLHVIVRSGGAFVGAADPRREGAAAGLD